jgi:hypothetical protein
MENASDVQEKAGGSEGIPEEAAKPAAAVRRDSLSKAYAG